MRLHGIGPHGERVESQHGEFIVIQYGPQPWHVIPVPATFAELLDMVSDLYPELAHVNIIVSTDDIGIGNLQGAQLRLNGHVWAAARPFLGVLKVAAGRHISTASESRAFPSAAVRTKRPQLVMADPVPDTEGSVVEAEGSENDHADVEEAGSLRTITSMESLRQHVNLEPLIGAFSSRIDLVENEWDVEAIPETPSAEGDMFESDEAGGFESPAALWIRPPLRAMDTETYDGEEDPMSSDARHPTDTSDDDLYASAASEGTERPISVEPATSEASQATIRRQRAGAYAERVSEPAKVDKFTIYVEYKGNVQPLKAAPSNKIRSLVKSACREFNLPVSTKQGPAFGLELVSIDPADPGGTMAASFLTSSSHFGNTETLQDIGAGQDTCFRLVEIKGRTS